MVEKINSQCFCIEIQSVKLSYSLFKHHKYFLITNDINSYSYVCMFTYLHCHSKGQKQKDLNE